MGIAATVMADSHTAKQQIEAGLFSHVLEASALVLKSDLFKFTCKNPTPSPQTWRSRNKVLEKIHKFCNLFPLPNIIGVLNQDEVNNLG